MPRIAIPDAEQPAIAASLRKWLPPNSDRRPPLIFRLFHVHPELASRARVLGAGFLAHHLLPLRDREMAIDRVTGKLGAAHEWGLHASTFGPSAELSEAHLTSTVHGPHATPELWSEDDLRFFDTVDELAESADLNDSTWAWLAQRYSDAQLMEFVLLVGWYRTVASVCNAFRLEEDSDSMPFPVSAT
ncbi:MULTISPECIES: hypothetical protein [unclassified Variovorax]|uniref:hypothetical protein n=1 Tax=unclassified Variovorax TaxID=663243 RepID=UPI0034E9648F